MPRWEFLPVSWAYNLATTVRNKLFDWNVIPSKKYNIPIIGIGNLSTGGTGKSPHTIYIVNLLKDDNEIAVVSRGYGRRSKGLKVANYNSTYEDIGDEPLQIFERFRNKIVVIVSEKRTEGIDKAITDYDSNLVILDDSFQHRHVNPGLKILLTSHDDLYSHDHVLPVGNLRESKSNADRADIIVITKCSNELSKNDEEEIAKQLKIKPHQKLFFSSIEYGDKVINRNNEIHLAELEDYDVILVTGIANADPMVDFVQNNVRNVKHIEFKDHHRFTKKDVQKIYEQLQAIKGNKLIITTEKDYMRLRQFQEIEKYLYYLPIEVKMHDKENFNQTIKDYVKRNN